MRIVQCVPNFSEGKDLAKIQKIISPLENNAGFKLLSVEPDPNYHRTVVTLLGDPEAMIEPLVAMTKNAIALIDLNHHVGEHPRMGAVDVIPFVPIAGIKMKECVEYAKMLGAKIESELNFPVFLYEEAASSPERINLADLRRGEFEGMQAKLKDDLWKPDFGTTLHPTAGIVAIGARMPLIAYNIDLGTDDLAIANQIARSIRHSSGGFRYVKAGSAKIADQGIVQVTMNITNYKKTSIYRIFETVKMEAARYGVNVLGSEVIGMLPLDALVQTAEYYLGLRDFSHQKVLETHILNNKL